MFISLSQEIVPLLFESNTVHPFLLLLFALPFENALCIAWDKNSASWNGHFHHALFASLLHLNAMMI